MTGLVCPERLEARLRHFHSFACLTLLTCTAAPTAVVAADAPPFSTLLQRAQATAPTLLVQDAEIEAARGLAQQAGARPNPTVGVQVDNLGVKDGVGLSQQETTLSASQVIELGGKRAARIEVGSAEVILSQARRALAEADFTRDLALSYAAAEAAQRRVKLAQDALEGAREDLRAARALVEAGKEADVRAVQANAAASAAEADVKAAQAALTTALAALSALTGAEQPYTGITPSLLARPLLALSATSPGYIAPSVAVAEAERHAAESRTRIEQVRTRPDLTVSVGARHFSGAGDTGLVAGLSAPLPFHDRNQGGIAASRAQVTVAQVRLSQARLAADTGARTALAQIAANESRLAAARQTVEAAQEAYRLARTGYEGGKTPLSEVLNARRAVTEAEDRVLDAQLARVEAAANLARLTGAKPFGE